MWRRRQNSPAASILTLILACTSTAAGEDWVVRNDFNERFYVYVRPQDQRKERGYSVLTLEPNQARRYALGADPHDLQVRPASGGYVVLEPTDLSQRGETKLSEIVSRQRRNGRVVYAVMQQDGFNLGQDVADILRGLGRSSWNTSYQSPNGQNVPARIDLNGNRGQLSNLLVHRSALERHVHAGRPDEPMRHRRRMASPGPCGRFLFHINNQNTERVKGEWIAQGESTWRPWSGSRIGGA